MPSYRKLLVLGGEVVPCGRPVRMRIAGSLDYRDHPEAIYREAHRAVNQVSNWQDQVPASTGEDYMEPWS